MTRPNTFSHTSICVTAVPTLFLLSSFSTADDYPALGPLPVKKAPPEGKAGCIECHNGTYLSDGKRHNTGIPENLELFKDPVKHPTYRSALHTYGVPNMDVWLHDYNRTDIPDTGPEGVSITNKQLMAFKSHSAKLNSLESPWSVWSDFYDFMKPRDGELDPLTMNYRYKIANGNVTRLGESPFKHKFSQVSFKRRDIV